MRSLSLFALTLLVSVLTPAVSNADNLLQVHSADLPSDSVVVPSRNGSAVVATTDSGTVLFRNLFQFDQVSVQLPEAITGSDVLAVSYYGRVYAKTVLGTGCGVRVYNESGVLSSTMWPSGYGNRGDESGCEIVSGHSNVTERLLYQTRDKMRGESLMLAVGGTISTVWSAETSELTDPKLEGYSINDLNTIVFTVSHKVGRKRVYASTIMVPGRPARELLMPRALKRRPVVRDINNRNKILVRSSSGAWTLDPVRGRAIRNAKFSVLIAPNGRGYAAGRLSTTPSTSVKVRCFATGELKGQKLQLLAVNDENELIVVGRSRSGAVLGKITPLSARGVPRC